MNILGCKWVYKIKYKSYGTIERFKSRLVAKGYHQVYGLDYNETFSPVVKASTIRTLLTVDVTNNWSMRQLDVSNAFLHGDLHEVVYMKQPQGFEDPYKPDYVCKLNKYLYGLKQASGAWFEKFSGFLIKFGFVMSDSDHSIFMYFSADVVLLILLYVDDILLIGSSPSTLSKFVNTLSTSFAMKDLGDLHYFLGIKVTKSPTTSSLLLTQSKYTLDLLIRTDMADCKPCHTPVASGTRISLHDGEPLSQPSDYRSIVGALQYLTFTRTDITLAVNYASQFMHAPTFEHMQLVKRILRYLKSSVGSGITISTRDITQLLGYSDSDWTGCPDTRRSTSGFYVFLGSTLVSWQSKKQPTVSKSSTEAEYEALSCLSSEVMWLTTLLDELHIAVSTPHQLFCDNLGAKSLALNPAFHVRTKHIELTYHYIRDLIKVGTVDVEFIPSALKIADVLTKGLPLPLLASLRDKLMHFTSPLASV